MAPSPPARAPVRTGRQRTYNGVPNPSGAVLSGESSVRSCGRFLSARLSCDASAGRQLEIFRPFECMHACMVLCSYLNYVSICANLAVHFYLLFTKDGHAKIARSIFILIS
ncbi:hypothetical protein BS78_04G313200 [Paspalum vaginatum]|nr:hypothetical protein BS78_04G313200 [Paspalum vaginatum]